MVKKTAAQIAKARTPGIGIRSEPNKHSANMAVMRVNRETIRPIQPVPLLLNTFSGSKEVQQKATRNSSSTRRRSLNHFVDQRACRQSRSTKNMAHAVQNQDTYQKRGPKTANWSAPFKM